MVEGGAINLDKGSLKRHLDDRRKGEEEMSYLAILQDQGLQRVLGGEGNEGVGEGRNAVPYLLCREITCAINSSNAVFGV